MKTATRYVVVKVDMNYPDEAELTPEQIIDRSAIIMDRDYVPEARATLTTEVLSISEKKPGDLTIINTGTPNTDRILGAALSGGDYKGLAEGMAQVAQLRKRDCVHEWECYSVALSPPSLSLRCVHCDTLACTTEYTAEEWMRAFDIEEPFPWIGKPTKIKVE